MRYFSTILTLLVVPFLVLTGCSKSVSKPTENREVTVSLNVSGDFDVEVSQDPLTRAGGGNDAYAINVYYDKEGDGTTNDLYAYGLFDNVADMSITLLSNHKYRVCCSLVKDAKTTLYYGQAFNNAYSGYCYPFQTSASNSTLVGNQFIIGTTTYFTGIGTSNSHLAATTSPSTSNYSKYAPGVNRFYGETDGYVPVPNGTIDVYLKRTVFGAQFVVSGLQEGTARIQCGEFYDVSFSADAEGPQRLYTFPGVRDVWQNELPLVATATVTYTSNRGSLWNITQTKDIQFKRNVMTTVNVQLSPDLSGIIFQLEEEALGDENDINMGINTDGLIDIIVNPNN